MWQSWNSIHLHVTFHGENTIIDSFRWHPPHWKSVMLTCSAIHILFHGASSQTKISYFDKFLLADQDIASGEISMNNILSWQILLWIETSIITVDAYYSSVLKSVGDKLIRVKAPVGDSLTKSIRRRYSWEISSLHDPVTWYGINYAET